jgi:hypothetical protein
MPLWELVSFKRGFFSVGSAPRGGRDPPAVELDQFGFEVGAYLSHDRSGPRGVVEHAVPSIRDEHQVGVKVVGDVAVGADVGLVPSAVAYPM